MSLSTSDRFTKAATLDKAKRKRPSPFPIRLSAEERAILERKAGNRSLGSYIRGQLLGEAEIPRKATRAPSLDRVALAQILGLLGKSEQVSCLFLLLAAAEGQRVSMADEHSTALQDACADVREMRRLLIEGLGLRT